MEESPLLPLPEEDDEDEEVTDRKKRSLPPLAALLKYPIKDKEATSQSIADTLLTRRREVNTDEKEDDTNIRLEAEEEDIPKLDGEELTLNEEQTADINQRIAQAHLEHPVTIGPPEEPVINFLQLVKGRVETEAAFRSTIVKHGLENPKEPPSAAVNEPLDVAQAEALPQPTLEEPIRPAQPERILPEKKVVDQKPNQVSSFASELAKLVIGRPSGSHNNNEALKHKQARVARKVEQMEAKVAHQENTLQKLSLEKSPSVRTTALKERTQPGRQESRLGLVKPERAEHIGKLVVNKENVASKHAPESSLKQAKTMRRAELLEISEKIKVEGASLRHMFDNNLFGEGALRRLVGAYLEGRQLQPLLRREILERQIDYERDPLLRDRINRDSDSQSVFDKMLESSPETAELNLAKQNNKPAKLALAQKKQEPKKDNQTKYHVSTIILGTTIAALIGIIVYLLVR